MKEHPVDNYFNEALKNIEVQPSASVWEKIDLSLEDKRKPWGMYFSIAASVAVVMAIFSYVLLKPQSSQPVDQQIFEEIQNHQSVTETNRPKTTQPGGTVPGSEKSIPIMAEQGQKSTINKHSNINRKAMAIADYEGDEFEFYDKTLWPIDNISIEKRKKSRFGISISNHDKYAANDETEESYGSELKKYTAATFKNIGSDEKLEKPPLPKLNLPKIKFEKNLNTEQ